MPDEVDDILLEAEDGEGSTGTPEQKLKQLRDRLKRAEAEASENLAGWQRTKADYVNLQKRSRDDLALLSDAAVGKVLEELIPVFDSLEAAAHESVLKQLDTVLGKLGVERYRPKVHDPFDPQYAEAVSTVATSDSSLDNTIHSVLQSGYRRSGVALRAARVMVLQHS